MKYRYKSLGFLKILNISGRQIHKNLMENIESDCYFKLSYLLLSQIHYLLKVPLPIKSVVYQFPDLKDFQFSCAFDFFSFKMMLMTANIFSQACSKLILTITSYGKDVHYPSNSHPHSSVETRKKSYDQDHPAST